MSAVFIFADWLKGHVYVLNDNVADCKSTFFS